MKKFAAFVLCTMLLVGCGGGGGGSSGSTNTAPVANAGSAQNVMAGAAVSLDGSASTDANGDALTYAWTLAKPAGSSAALSSASAPKPTFTADLAGSYTASLVVNDGKVDSASAAVTVTAVGGVIDSLVGSWLGTEGITSHPTRVTDTADITVSVASNVLTIVTDELVGGVGGTCTYTAPVNANRDGAGPGTYQCVEADASITSGNWQLSNIRRVDVDDRHIQLIKDGTVTKRLYGMAAGAVTVPQTLPASIASLVGTYEGVARWGSTVATAADPIQVVVAGQTLTLTVKRVPGESCDYTATIQPNGLSVSNGTYNCAGATGTWSLIDLRSIGGGDVYVSVRVGNEARRAYGLAK